MSLPPTLDHEYEPSKFSGECQVMLPRYRCPYPEAMHPPKGVPWWEEECFRASGNVICAICGEQYWRHPGATDEVGTLVRACNGKLLKL